MAPKGSKKRSTPPDPDGMFTGMVVFLVEDGVQSRRLQIWKQKLAQMGAMVEASMSKSVTHIFAMNLDSLIKQFTSQRLQRFKGPILIYQWLEDSLKLGEKVPADSYVVRLDPERYSPKRSSEENALIPANGKTSSGNQPFCSKKIKPSIETSKDASAELRDDARSTVFKESSHSLSPSITHDDQDEAVSSSDASLPYSPPDLNRNITEIFGKLINIYRALGDDRRSFSYYKAIPVIEKLPFKIESVDQVKHLPAVGKSMQEHASEQVYVQYE